MDNLRICKLGITNIYRLFNNILNTDTNMDNYTIYRSTQITSMMWPLQNFLLYNGTMVKKINEWIDD